MKKITSLSFIENLLWLLNPCLIVLCIFSDHLTIGAWLSWLGQWHPVILHFPIVVGIVIGIYYLVSDKYSIPNLVEKYIIYLYALLSSIVALLGILISIGGNYDKSLLITHQWGGLSIALLAWLWALTQNFSWHEKIIVKKWFGAISIIVIIFFTHKGGQLTHGKEALALPSKVITTIPNNKPDSLLTVYEKAVQPILMDKCVGCHGGDKTKGELKLTSIELIKKGGKHGDKITDRIHLPLADEKHMPPNDKKQLTKEELSILTKWMQLGGDLNKALHDLSKQDSLYILASQYIAPRFDKIKEQPDLTKYNSNYVSVQYDFHGASTINVNFFQGAFYKTAFLENLAPLKTAIVSLNMQSIPLHKEDIAIIAGFENLEKINLNYTKLSIEDITPLSNLQKLRSISLAGMPIDTKVLSNFLQKSKLKKIQVWTSGFKPKDLDPLRVKFPEIEITVGDNLEDSVMKLNKPLIQQDSSIITDKIHVPLKHFLKGVTIKYTLDDSEPDSITSPTYTAPLILTKNTTLKTKVFKPGWLASDLVQKSFYKSEFYPDTIILQTLPDPKYKGMGGHTIIDHELGDLNFGNGKWLGYSKTNMEFIMQFSKATAINEIIFNALINTPSYIFPIQTIQVEASDNGKEFHVIQNADFTAITKAYTKEPNINQTQAFKVKLNKAKAYKYYKLTLRNLKKLPIWHPGKGTPAWIFVDEVFFN